MTDLIFKGQHRTEFSQGYDISPMKSKSELFDLFCMTFYTCGWIPGQPISFDNCLGLLFETSFLCRGRYLLWFDPKWPIRP